MESRKGVVPSTAALLHGYSPLGKTPHKARFVRAGKDGVPITDGVFPESKEFLAGYLIVDVEGTERAYEIAAIWSAAPGPGGLPLNMPNRSATSHGVGEPANCREKDLARCGDRAPSGETRSAGCLELSCAISRFSPHPKMPFRSHAGSVHAMAARGCSENHAAGLIRVAIPPDDRPDAQRNCTS